MFIDIYTHIFPSEFYHRMNNIAPHLGNIGKRMQNVKALHDLDERFRSMDPFGDYRQIISLPNPPLEDISTPAEGIELARIGTKKWNWEEIASAAMELKQKHGIISL